MARQTFRVRATGYCRCGSATRVSETTIPSLVMVDLRLAMDSFPLNMNSKTNRHALAAQLENSIVQDNEAVIFEGDGIKPYDALRLACSRRLDVPFKNLDAHSSFTSLGGNSLTVIKLSNHLRTYNFSFSISVAQKLRLNGIDTLQEALRAWRVPERRIWRIRGGNSNRHPETTSLKIIERSCSLCPDQHQLIFKESAGPNCQRASQSFHQSPVGTQHLSKTLQSDHFQTI
jgi:hypothetical protein